MLSLGVTLPQQAVLAPRGGGGGGFVFPELQPLIASACMDLDATSAASYAGSGQTWANLVTTPADGAGQTAYDFWLGAGAGAEGSDPAFVGAAGDRGAKFTLNGSQYFTLKGANTTLIKNARKTTGGAAHTLAICVKTPAKVINTLPGVFFGTNALDGGTPGWTWTNGTFGSSDGRIAAYNVGGWQVAASATAGAACADGTMKLLVLCYTPAGNATIKTYSGEATPQIFSQGFVSAVADPAYPLQIGAAGNGAAPLYNGSEIIAASLFNEVLSDAQQEILRSMYSTRHNTTY